MKKKLVVAAVICFSNLFAGPFTQAEAQQSKTQLPAMQELQTRLKNLREEKKYLVVQIKYLNDEIAKLQPSKQVDQKKLQDLKKRRDLYTRSVQNIEQRELELIRLEAEGHNQRLQKAQKTVRDLQ